MRTPPMVKAMNEREINYNERKLAATLTGSKHNFFQGLQSKIESPKVVDTKPTDDNFILRLQDRSRRLLQDYLQSIKDNAEQRLEKATFSNGKKVINDVTWMELAQVDEKVSAKLWQEREEKKRLQEDRKAQELKDLALKMKNEN